MNEQENKEQEDKKLALFTAVVLLIIDVFFIYFIIHYELGGSVQLIPFLLIGRVYTFIFIFTLEIRKSFITGIGSSILVYFLCLGEFYSNYPQIKLNASLQKSTNYQDFEYKLNRYNASITDNHAEVIFPPLPNSLTFEYSNVIVSIVTQHNKMYIREEALYKGNIIHNYLSYENVELWEPYIHQNKIYYDDIRYGTNYYKIYSDYKIKTKYHSVYNKYSKIYKKPIDNNFNVMKWLFVPGYND
jgi:hypothetical protein